MYIIKNLTFGYTDEVIIKDLSLTIPKGKITTILGQNGSGKSTLFKLLTKACKHKVGEISFMGRDLKTYKRKEFAKEVAVVHQYHSAPHDITVYALVRYGRTPHPKFYSNNKEDI